MTLTHPFEYHGLVRLHEECRDWDKELDIEKSWISEMFKRHGLTVTRIEAKYTGASPDDGERTTFIYGETREEGRQFGP